MKFNQDALYSGKRMFFNMQKILGWSLNKITNKVMEKHARAMLQKSKLRLNKFLMLYLIL